MTILEFFFFVSLTSEKERPHTNNLYKGVKTLYDWRPYTVARISPLCDQHVQRDN